VAAIASARAPASTTAAAPPPFVLADSTDIDKDFQLADATALPWTGDIDGMVERRMIRVLVTFSRTHYFVDKGTQRGLTYDTFHEFETHINKKLKNRNIRVHVFFIPVARDELIPALLAGRGDVAAANLTIMPDRQAQVDFVAPTFRDISEIVVTAPGADPITTVTDLSGREVYVRQSSSYYESIQQLNAQLAATGKDPVKVRLAPEELETEDILEMVNAGLVKITVVDSHLAKFWVKVYKKIVLVPGAVLRSGGRIAPAIRPGSPLLQAELDAFIARYKEGSQKRNVALQSYLANTRFAREATSPSEVARFEATVDLFRKYGDKYDLDYLLMMAEGYQESALNQNAKSPVGAIGVMQVMPGTGKDMNVGDIARLEPNIHAGVKYINWMMDKFFADEQLDPLNKGLLTFASYNAGPTRIANLRKLAAKRGLDPDKWFNNVEVVVAEKIGRETVQYVSNIYKYYLAYKMLAEAQFEREQAKQRMGN
jgi:membrane-bound lytic murein transglycosylase MltF